MFGFNSNKSKWKQIANSCNDALLSEIITEMFIPFNINLNKLTINTDCFENRTILSNEYSRYCTPSMEEWCLMPLHNLPLGIPDWFYPAFPEVATWIGTPEAGKYIDSITEGKNSYELNDRNNKIRMSILRQMVESYIKVTGKRLEVAD